MLDLFDEALFFRLGPTVSLKAVLKFFDSFLQLALFVVNWMDILALLIEFAARVLDLLSDDLDRCKLILLLISVGLELAE